MSKNKSFSYCFRVYDYDQYLYDVGELRAMGYNIEDWWDDIIIKENPRFNVLYLHIQSHDSSVGLYDHYVGAEIVPNLEYIINELPVIKNISSKAV